MEKNLQNDSRTDRESAGGGVGMTAYHKKRDSMLAAPWVHESLKAAIRAFDACDPVDAAHDAEMLEGLMRQRCEEIFAAHRAKAGAGPKA
jgi:hypothetical protein